MKIFIPLVTTALLAGGNLLHASQELTNIALRRPCTGEPRLGTHPATLNGQEYRKLTDGKRASKPLWEAKEETIGWRAGRAPISVTVDLGKREPISGVALGSGAGMALDSKQVFFWPGLINIFVSDDNKEWFHVGELTSLHDSENAPLPAFNGEYAYRNISTTRLKTSGRYVKFVFTARAEVFLDEVEVYRGDDSFVTAPRTSKPIKEDKIADYVTRFDATLFVAKRRYRLDIDSIRSQLANLSPEQAAPIQAALDKLKQEVDELKASPEDKRAAIPVGELGRRILEQQAAVWRAQGKPELTVWQQGLWDHLYWMTPPPAQTAKPQLEISLIRGEQRSTSFNLTNASGSEQRYLIKVSGLGDGAHPAGLEVRATEWNEQVDRTATAFALLPAKEVAEGYEVAIPAGMTRQVWLTLEGQGEAGEKSGTVSIVAQEKEAVELPLQVKLYALDFPEKQSLHFSGWDYLNALDLGRYAFTPTNNESALALLKRYRLDTNWSPVTALDRGKFNEQGEYGSPEDEPKLDAFKKWVALWPDAHRYYVNIAAFNPQKEPKIMGYLHKDDPEGFFKRVKTWLQFWEKAVKEQGIDPKRVALLIVDEPGLHGSHQYAYDEHISIWVEAINRAGTSFTQWMDPVYPEPWGANQSNLDAMDEICVKFAHLVNNGPRYVDYYRKRGEKQQLSLYECYPLIGGFDPYSYYRLQAWMSWSMGGNGIGIWSVADAGRGAIGSWNNGLSPLHYSPLFVMKNQPDVYAGKGIEGIREGIYDYEYLVMLRDAIEAAKKDKKSEETIAAAERLLEEAPKRVLWENKALSEPKWLPSTRIDRSIADQTRLEILDTITALKN